jgi:hypothetical protein
MECARVSSVSRMECVGGELVQFVIWSGELVYARSIRVSSIVRSHNLSIVIRFFEIGQFYSIYKKLDFWAFHE